MPARIVLYPHDLHEIPAPRLLVLAAETLAAAERWTDEQDGGSYIIAPYKGTNIAVYKVPDADADRYAGEAMGLGTHVERRVSR